jgi:hypothetical protein
MTIICYIVASVVVCVLIGWGVYWVIKKVFIEDQEED